MINGKEFFILNYMKLIFIFYLLFLEISFVSPNYHFIEFTSKHYRAGHFALNLNKDMVIEYSYNNFRFFFGLKQNGKSYFKKNDKEIYNKELEITESPYKDFHRYESKNIFISLENDTNIQYLLSISTYHLTELYNLDTNEYKIKKTNEYFDKRINTYIFPILTIGNKNEYYIIYLAQNQTYFNCYITKFSFNNFDFCASKQIKKNQIIKLNINHRSVSGFIMNDNIVVFYLEYIDYYDYNNYYINIYNINLVFLYLRNLKVKK